MGRYIHEMMGKSQGSLELTSGLSAGGDNFQARENQHMPAKFRKRETVI